jgi:hypothetical protein
VTIEKLQEFLALDISWPLFKNEGFMQPGRELNIKIATEIFGYKVWKHKGKWTENPPAGDRPLRNYSNDMQFAWEVAEKMKITLIPIVGGQWFAFVGSPENAGWESPKAVLQFLEAGNFTAAGAALDANPALAICIAAIKASEKNKTQANPSISVPENTLTH